MSVSVCTRFAASLAAPLHIAEARTALFNWLLARQAAGRFYLRIDDASAPTADAAGILDDLRWLGAEPDLVVGPELDACASYYTTLIEAGRAYCAFDTPDELALLRRQALDRDRPFRYPRPANPPTPGDVEQARQQGRPVVLRFRMPPYDITFDDQVLGRVTFRAAEHEDFIIRSPDGSPSRTFAAAIDDAQRGITHVLQGQEHLVDVCRQIALQEALGFARPVYAHLPLILNPDGTRLSRSDRDVDVRAGRPPRPVDVRDFRAAGYLPEVLVQFLAQLGLSPSQEPLSDRQGLLRSFDVKRISRTAPRFDRAKLLALNAQAMAQTPAASLLPALRDCLRQADSPLQRADDASLTRLLNRDRRWQTFRDLDHDQECVVGGIISEVRYRHTRRNERMASIRLEDLYGTIPVTFFPANYKACESQLAKDRIVLVKGRACHATNPLAMASSNSLSRLPEYESRARRTSHEPVVHTKPCPRRAAISRPSATAPGMNFSR